MIALARRVPAADDAVPVGPQRLRRRRQRDGGALLRHAGRPRQDVGVRDLPGCWRRCPASCSRSCRGRARPTSRTATSWISSRRPSSAARAWPAAAGRWSGAVLGALIFGVLRNALPQIPGATFYDRLIVGVVVIVIVVMDQVLVRRAIGRRVQRVGSDVETR